MGRSRQPSVHRFPPVSKEAALEIALRALAETAAAPELIVHGRKPKGFGVYAVLPEPCWWVQVQPQEGALRIESSRVIVIGRNTGTIHYDGSAHDEG